MKWQGYSENTTDRVNNVLFKVFKGRSLFVLTALTAVVVAAAASFKWGG